MEEDSVSNTSSNGGHTSLCGFSGSRKSTVKKSRPHSQKSSRKSPQKQPENDSSLNTGGKEPPTSPTSAVGQTSKNGEESLGIHVATDCPDTMTSPTSTNNSSSNKKSSSGDKDVTKTKSEIEKSSKKLSFAARTRSFFHIRKKTYSPASAQSGVDNEQGGSGNVALTQDTSPTSSSLTESKSFHSKHGHRVTDVEIKPNTVSQRRAAFEVLSVSGEQPSRSSQVQPSAKTDKKVITGVSTVEDKKTSPSEDGPSCSHKSTPSEPLSSSSTHLEPSDELGSKAEKKTHSKRSFFQFFKSKRSSGEKAKNVQDKSKSKDKKKTKTKEGSGEDESFEASGGSSAVVASSSHVKKSQLKTKTVGKEAEQGKAKKQSLLQEQNKSRESMMKAIHKGVENLAVPERLQSVIVKPSPAIREETASAKVDSHSERHDVEIPDNDDDVFFSATPKKNADQSNIPSATTEDLDFMERDPILKSNKKPIKPQKNQKTTGNPVRKLAERKDVTTSYVETPASTRTSGFADEALRGLAAKINYSDVALRKVDSSSSPAVRYQPFKEKMLLLVKGRKKHCHARLVEPCVKSFNTGDCYVLVTSNSVHVWIGGSCNVLEKPKAYDIAKQIVVKHDLGYKASSDMIVIEQKTKVHSKSDKDFWSIIGESKVPKVQENGPPEEDEIYEKSVCETNIVYKVSGTRLKPLEDHCGSMLSYEMLNANTSAVLIFDFGGEMYVWIGKQSPKDERQYGMQLAEELWKKGYDYTSFRMNPLSLLHDKKSGGLPLKGHVRPAWALLGKLTQGTETILFKEKFYDWPDPSRIIQLKMSTAQSESKEDWLVTLKPYDVDKMMKSKGEPLSFLWDGIPVGRSLTWVSEANGLKKEYVIDTEGIDVWHVAEFDCSLMDEAYHGNFFDGDTYVVRWRYQVNVTGLAKGARSRCTYFYWQGEGSSITEKGACALMTVELDKEKGPQVRVEQNKEPPCFLALFKGRMIVHKGKKEEKLPSSGKGAHLYIVRNELPDEAYLLEIPVQMENLRSRSSFLLLNAECDHLTVWHGARSHVHTKQRAVELVNNLQKWLSLKLNCDWKKTETEMNEGSESAAFWKAIGSSDRSQYDSLLKSSVSLNCSLRRAFHLSAVTLTFEAKEVHNPSMNEKLCCPFPVFQSELYGSEQPALFLIDSGDVVYLWQGYWPLETRSTENLTTGSADSKFTAERRCAMETVLAYCSAVNPTKPPPAYIVFAGVEPVSFTNLFPTWSTDDTARTSNIKDGKKVGQMSQVSEILASLMKNEYTLAELQSDTPPDGVDPLKLESYLADEEFQSVFGCDKDAFYQLPSWKQIEAKQGCKLY